MSDHYKAMLKQSILSNPAVRDRDDSAGEEWSNFMQRVGEVAGVVRDLAGSDPERAAAASVRADALLTGKDISTEDVHLRLKHDRTLINKTAFDEPRADGQMDKNAFMAEVERDASRRAHDRKVAKEKADTLNTLAIKHFRRGDYEKALSYYNKAIEHVRDNPMYYCDRALTNIKLGHFDKVFKDCELALRLNEKSFKARLYAARAHKELGQLDELAAARAELKLVFPQHDDLVHFFLDKKPSLYDDENTEDYE